MIAKTGFPEYLESITIGPNANFLKTNTDLCHVVNQFETEVNLTYMWKHVERDRDTLTATRQFVKNFMLDAPDLDTEFLLHYTKKINNLNPAIRDAVKYETREVLKKASTMTPPMTGVPGGTTVTGSASGRNFDPTKPIHEDNDFINRLADLMDSCDAPCDYFAPVTDKIGSLIDYSRYNSLGNAAVGDLEGHTPPPTGIGLNVLNKIPSLLQDAIATAFTSAKIAIDAAMTSLTNPTGKINFTQLAANGVTPDQQGLTFTGSTNSSMFHDINSMHTNMRTKIKELMQDCYRSAEFETRYNPFNPAMNMAVAQEKYFDVTLKSATGERPYTIGASGQAKYVYQNNQTTIGALNPATSKEASQHDDMVTAPAPRPRRTPTAPSLNGTPTSRDSTGSKAYDTNDASEAIRRSALKNIGRSTSSIPGTQQGNVACAASVNIIVTEALGYPAGGGLATAMMYPALKNNTAQWKAVSVETAIPGSIIISPTDHGKTGHVGIIVDTSGNIVSNSSGKRAIQQNYNISTWKKRYEGTQGLQTYAFTHTGPTNSSVREALSGSSPAGNPLAKLPTGISDRLLSFVKSKEGFDAKAKWDYHQWSVGYGSVAKYPNEVISESEATARLANELQVHASAVDSAAKSAGLKFTEGQRDALISYSYNAGTGAAKKLINSVNGDVSKISSAIANGVKTAGGKVIPGLADRRSAESRLANS